MNLNSRIGHSIHKRARSSFKLLLNPSCFSIYFLCFSSCYSKRLNKKAGQSHHKENMIHVEIWCDRMTLRNSVDWLATKEKMDWLKFRKIYGYRFKPFIKDIYWDESANSIEQTPMKREINGIFFTLIIFWKYSYVFERLEQKLIIHSYLREKRLEVKKLQKPTIKLLFKITF